MTSRAATLPPHLSGTAVSAAADSELSAPERARVLSHLSRCAACRGRLVTELATKDLVHSLGLGAPTPPSDLNRTLLSMGERSGQVPSVRLVQAHGRGPRPGAVGVLSAVGLTLGLAAAAVVPVGSGATPAPTGTAAAAQVVGGSSSAARQSGSPRASVAMPAVFTTGGGPVAPVRGTAPGVDASTTPAVRRAALIVVVQALMARLETFAGP